MIRDRFQMQNTFREVSAHSSTRKLITITSPMGHYKNNKERRRAPRSILGNRV